jgi:predicted RNA-binding Zn-ribbon protein involved in translation (DUF1610 family)
MLKINCPECNKDFFWTDDMPVQGKCLNPDCEANYDIHSALKQNIDKHTATEEKKILQCPSCGEEISSRFTVCRHCSHIVLGTMSFRKSYFFIAVCIFLIGLSLILQYLVK